MMSIENDNNLHNQDVCGKYKILKQYKNGYLKF